MNHKFCRHFALPLSLLACLGADAFGDDWPQFNGPTRDGVLPTSYSLEAFPDAGLQKNWSTPISGGYSGPAIADGKVYVTDYAIKSGKVTNNPGGRDELEGDERLHCLDATTGKVIWTYQYPRSVDVSFGIGPRATPTVDGQSVYSLGSEGDLIAVDTTSGELRWSLSLKEKYGAETPLWGFAASPLIHGELLYTLAGGEGSVAVALNKNSGQEVWRALSSSGVGYCPPTMINSGDELQLLIWDAKNLNSLDPATGKVNWTTPLAPSYEMSIAPPLQHKDLLYASGIGDVAAMYRILPKNSGVEKLWEGKAKTAVYCSNASGVFTDDLIVGSDCGSGELIAVNPKDGERYWATMQPTAGGDRRASHGTAFLSKGPENRYYLFSETGDLIVSKISPSSYEELSRTHLIDGTNTWQGRNVVWAYPAFSNGNIVVRNDQEIASFKLP